MLMVQLIFVESFPLILSNHTHRTFLSLSIDFMKVRLKKDNFPFFVAQFINSSHRKIQCCLDEQVIGYMVNSRVYRNKLL